MAANDEAPKEWEQGDGAKLKGLETALAEAKNAKVEEKVKNLSVEAKPLQEALGDLLAENREKSLALLTDEQLNELREELKKATTERKHGSNGKDKPVEQGGGERGEVGNPAW